VGKKESLGVKAEGFILDRKSYLRVPITFTGCFESILFSLGYKSILGFSGIVEEKRL
jgi:hypothetical protein